MSQQINDRTDLDKKFSLESFIGCEDDQREADLIRRVQNSELYKENNKKQHLKSWQKPAE